MRVIEMGLAAEFHPFQVRCPHCSSVLAVERADEVRYIEGRVGAWSWLGIGKLTHEFRVFCIVCFEPITIPHESEALISPMCRVAAISGYRNEL